MGTPSTTNNGWLVREMDEAPRMRIIAEAPGEPEALTTITPAALLLSALTMLVSRELTNSSALTDWTE